jgi:UDP-glucose:(heptosyl)LPS alpha-1,3-glucosyltransferase
MNIAYVVYDFTRAGGIERYVRELSIRMSAAGHDVHVITAVAPNEPVGSLRFHTLHVATLLPGFLRLIFFRKQVERFLTTQQFAIVHSQGTDCLTHNVLTAHSCHKAWVEKAKTFGWWERCKKACYPLHRIVVRNELINYTHYTAIIAVSEEVKREIVEYYNVPAHDIAVIHPGVYVTKSPPGQMKSSSLVRARLGLSAGDFIVLFVGNEFRRKGLSILIAALGKLSSHRAHLLVVGKGCRFVYTVMAWISRVRRNVHFLGPTENVSAYFAASDIFVMPTKHEAFGMVITEAMAAGLPVIVPRYAGAAALIKDKRCLLHDPSDVNEVAEKIGYFAENRVIAESVGATLCTAARSVTWDAMAARVAEVYERITA